jgi:hypothetical protein
MNDLTGSFYVLALKWLFFAWLSAYGLCFLIALVQPLGNFVLSGFELAPTSQVQVLNTLRLAFIWLLPTGLLAFALWMAEGRPLHSGRVDS